MSRGAIIMSFFASLFVALTLAWQYHFSGPVLIAPFAVFAGIASAALYVLSRPGSGTALSAKAKRTLILASSAEGIGIYVAIGIVLNLHRPDWRLPAMALIVGLHFLPLAQAFKFRPYWILGSVLIAVGLLGFVLPGPLGGALAGMVAAVCLWGTALFAVFQDWKKTVERRVVGVC